MNKDGECFRRDVSEREKEKMAKVGGRGEGEKREGKVEEEGMQARMTSQFKLVKTVGYIQDQVTLLGTTFRTCKKSYNFI